MSKIKQLVISGKEYDIAGLPEGGDEGQVLTKGAGDDYNWMYYTPKIWKGTLTEYASLQAKEDDCLYFIIEDGINVESEDDSI